VQRITIGRHYGESKHAFTHAISVQLNDERALEDYLSHAARLQYNAQYLDPIEEERIEIDVPMTMTLLPDPCRNWEWGASVGMGPPLED
jgi:Stress responsive A/B Barrel Domain